MLYKNREKFNSVSVKVGMVFSKIPLTPNQWTLLSIVPVLFAAWFISREEFLFGAIAFIIAAFMDLIDGSVARVTGRATKFGAYLDTIMDRYVEGIIVFSLLFVPLPGLVLGEFNIGATTLIFIFFFGGFLTSYAKAAAKEKELVQEELKGGIFERAERLVVLFVGILLAIVSLEYLTLVLALLAVLSNVSALQRIWKAKANA